MRVVRIRLVAASLVALGLVLGAGIGFLSPTAISGAVGWSFALFGVFWGLGSAVRRWLRIDLGLGEQLVLGSVAWVFLSGVLLAVGQASTIPLFGIAGIGLSLAVIELVTRARSTEPWVRPSTAVLVMGGLLAALLVFNLVGMISTRANPYDDQVVYTGFVKRVLDVGDLDEPFSFRRLSAYGGQTMLQAAAALRGDVESIDLLDRGIFQIIGVLLVLDMIRRRRLHLGIAVGVIAFLLTLWDLALNSAAIWTGFTYFVAAYHFASRDDLAPRTSLILTFAVAAAACTLRQNYLLPAGLFALFVLVFHLRAQARLTSWRDAWRVERRTSLLAIAAAAIVLLPYLIAAWQAVHTFLYPILPGTANPAIPLRPSGSTILDELNFFVTVALNSEPIRVWWLLAPLMLLAKDTRARRPLLALIVAVAIGFTFLIHSFMLSDAYNMWRYGFAYMTALAVVFVIEASTRLPFVDRDDPPTVLLAPVASVLVVIVVMVHFTYQRRTGIDRFQAAVQNIKFGLEEGSRKFDPYPERYQDLQQTIPEGATMAVLLDDPYHLDYARNRIYNLDLPGFAGPGAGLPSFTSLENWRAYFASHGIRYIAFVHEHSSNWLYRRAGWVWRMYADDELFRLIAARMVDTIDTFHELAKAKTLYEHDGLVAFDLGEPTAAVEPDRGLPEVDRMDRYAREFSEQDLGSKAWQLASRRDVVFQADGAAPAPVVPLPGDESPGMFELVFGRNPPGRWLLDRTHVRLRGSGQHRLHVKLWIRPGRLSTVPTMVVKLDGQIVASGKPDPAGDLVLDAPVECTGWCDLYLVLSTISDWWWSAEQIKGVRLLEFDWTKP